MKTAPLPQQSHQDTTGPNVLTRARKKLQDALEKAKQAAKKKRRRRKKPDPGNREWKPRSKQHYMPLRKRGARATIQLMQAHTPDAKKAAVRGSRLPLPKLPSTTLSRTPIRKSTAAEETTEATFFTPKQKTELAVSRVIQLKDHDVTIFLPKDKVKKGRLEIPSVISDAHLETLEALSINERGSLEPSLNVKYTAKDFERTERQIRRDRIAGKSQRSQEKVMKCSARNALKAAGVIVKPRQAHWIHFVAHSAKGRKTQKPGNLAIATKNCNAEMQLIEPVIEKILRSDNHPDALYVDFIPEWVAGYEKIRLLNKLTVVIKDADSASPARHVRFTFDGLATKQICTTEVELIEGLLLDTFNNQRSEPNGNLLLSPRAGLTPIIKRTNSLQRPGKLPKFSLPDLQEETEADKENVENILSFDAPQNSALIFSDSLLSPYKPPRKTTEPSSMTTSLPKP